MTLRRGRDGALEVHTDAEGRRYALCEGVVALPDALQGAPLAVQEEWAARVRCGRSAPLPSDPAGDEAAPQACPACLDTAAGPPEALQTPCSYHNQGCPAVLNPSNCVAYSRRGVSLHRCRYWHFSFATFL